MGIYESARYPFCHTETVDAALDIQEKVLEAEWKAVERVTINRGGKPHTAHQMCYIKQPTPMYWGYCVEEQLNQIIGNTTQWTIQGTTWTTQYSMGAIRPDYCLKAKNVRLFVDLTTDEQSGYGCHITNKLIKVEGQKGKETWEACDITHSGYHPLGKNGGKVKICLPKGVKEKHIEAFMEYSSYVQKDNASWEEGMDKVYTKYERLSMNTFLGWKLQKRNEFTQDVHKARQETGRDEPGTEQPKRKSERIKMGANKRSRT